MRIALVSPGGFSPDGRDRIVPALVWLVERLARTHELHAFIFDGGQPPGVFTLAGATVHSLGDPRGPGAKWRALGRALDAAGRFDVIHGYWASPAGLAAAIAGRRLGIPSVVTLDSGELVSLPDISYGMQRTWRGRLAVRLACRLATTVTVCSEYMRSLASARRIEARLLPFGVDRRVFQNHGPRADGPPWRLLQVANLNPVKDQATLLRALARVRESGVDARLDLVGRDTLAGRIQQHASALALSEAVSFHGFVPSDELRPFHARAHLYVQSSRHEAAGLSVLEAAVSGVPIAGSRTGHLADLAPDGALAVDPGDPEALSAAITSLVRDPHRRADLAHRADRWACAHDADWTAGELEQLYRRPALRS
jgi:glycosyltransferase involved in cell wall biosynthesis